MENVGREICVGVGKGAAHIVALVASALNKFLEFREYNIVAASALIVLAEAVVYFFSAVKA